MKNNYKKELDNAKKNNRITLSEFAADHMFDNAEFTADPEKLVDVIESVCSVLFIFTVCQFKKELPAFYCRQHMRELEKLSACSDSKKIETYAFLDAAAFSIFESYDNNSAFEILNEISLTDISNKNLLHYEDKLRAFFEHMKEENYTAKTPCCLETQGYSTCRSMETEKLISLGAHEEELIRAKDEDCLFAVYGPDVTYPVILSDNNTAFIYAEKVKTDEYEIKNFGYDKIHCLEKLISKVIEANPQFTFSCRPRNTQEKNMSILLTAKHDGDIYYLNTEHEYSKPDWVNSLSKIPYVFCFYKDIPNRQEEDRKPPEFMFNGSEYKLKLKTVSLGPLENLLYIQKDGNEPMLLDVNAGGAFYLTDCPYVLYTYSTPHKGNTVAYSLITGEKTILPGKMNYPFSYDKQIKYFNLPDYIKIGGIYRNSVNKPVFINVSEAERRHGIYFPSEKYIDDAVCKVGYDIYIDSAVIYDYNKEYESEYLDFVRAYLKDGYKVTADNSAKRNTPHYIPEKTESIFSHYKKNPHCDDFETECRCYNSIGVKDIQILDFFKWSDICKKLTDDYSNAWDVFDYFKSEAKKRQSKNSSADYFSIFYQYDCLSDLIFKKSEDDDLDECIDFYLRNIPLCRKNAENLMDAAIDFDDYRIYETLLVDFRHFLTDEEIKKYIIRCKETFSLPVPAPQDYQPKIINQKILMNKIKKPAIACKIINFIIAFVMLGYMFSSITEYITINKMVTVSKIYTVTEMICINAVVFLMVLSFFPDGIKHKLLKDYKRSKAALMCLGVFMLIYYLVPIITELIISIIDGDFDIHFFTSIYIVKKALYIVFYAFFLASVHNYSYNHPILMTAVASAEFILEITKLTGIGIAPYFYYHTIDLLCSVYCLNIIYTQSLYIRFSLVKQAYKEGISNIDEIPCDFFTGEFDIRY